MHLYVLIQYEINSYHTHQLSGWRGQHPNGMLNYRFNKVSWLTCFSDWIFQDVGTEAEEGAPRLRHKTWHELAILIRKFICANEGTISEFNQMTS